MNFYRLRDNVDYLNRWYLGEVLSVDNWALLRTDKIEFMDFLEAFNKFSG